MNNDNRWKQRFQNFEKAYEVFKRRIDDYEKDNDNEAYTMSLIQAFEMVQELSWKVLKDYLENEGYDDVKNPKKVMRTAFQDELITNHAETWMQSIENRNLTTHTYDNDTLNKILDFIDKAFQFALRDLYDQLKKEL